MAIRHKDYAEKESTYESLPVPHQILLVQPGQDTLIAARDEVRRIISEGLPEGGIQVLLEEGEYQLTETLLFDERDSGTLHSPVVWCVREGKKVTISGGERLEAEGFSPVTADDPLYMRLPEPEKTLVFDLKAKWIETEPYSGGFGEAYNGEHRIAGQNMTGSGWPQLFWGDSPLQLVRYPADGYLLTVRSETSDDGLIRFGYDDPRIDAFQEPEKAWLQGYFRHDWANVVVRVGNVDLEKRRIKSEETVSYGVQDEHRYFFLNVPEELCVPGQYWLDAENGRLYLMPPDNFTSEPLHLSCVREALFRFDNASHIHLRGLRFSYARGSGVMIYGGDGIAVEGCSLCNLGYMGVVIGCQKTRKIHRTDRQSNGGKNHVVRSCDIWNTAFGGINVAAGNRETLESCGVRIENCDIHDFGYLGKSYFFAVSLSSIGAVVANNRFHGGAHAAIWFDGNDNVIEYNEFYDLLRESDDAAAIYCGRDYTLGGNIVRYNFFHDMKSDAKLGVSVFGTYCDDHSASLAYYGNLYYRMQSAHLSHGGHDILFENNLIVEENGVSQNSVIFGRYWYPRTLTGDGEHIKTFENAPTETTLWHLRFPHLYDYPTWPPEEQTFPHYCRYRNNAIVRHRPFHCNFDWDRPEYRNVVENNAEIDEDAGFVDEERLDLRLREDSPVYREIPGFVPIPYEKIGLYRDEFRR